jgi:hypothetical protein
LVGNAREKELQFGRGHLRAVRDFAKWSNVKSEIIFLD